MNYSPYEMKILLEIHCGMALTVNRFVPLFTETMMDFVSRGLVEQNGGSYLGTPALSDLMAHVLNAPKPMRPGARPKLTERQTLVLGFVKSHAAKTGTPPTRAEIAEHFDFKSPNAAQDHLRALEKKGYLKIEAGGHRSLRVVA